MSTLRPKYTFLLVLTFCLSINLNGKTDRYRLVIRDNPATSMVVGWQQVSGLDAKLYYGTEDFGQNWKDYPHSQAADKTIEYKGMNNHFVRLKGLKPQTHYYFVIRDSEGVSQRFRFETLPNKPSQKLSIVAGGDARGSGIGNQAIDPRIKTNSMVAKIQPHLVLFGGDFTLRDSDGQWQAWFDDWQHSFTKDGKITPLVPARGNHEDSDEVLVNLFDISSAKGYYNLTLGGKLAQIYTLNTLISIEGDQTDWLNKELKKNEGKQTWRIVQYHQPMFPHHERKKLRPDIYNNWAGLFYQYHVNLVVECDAHVVKSTWPMKPSKDPSADHGMVRADEDGTIYVGEGTWALTRSKIKAYSWTRGIDSFLQFRWMIVGPESLEVRTVKIEESQGCEPVSPENRFSLPKGVVLWEPGNFTLTLNSD
ncbi:metallophosphoesterase family protein [bacterium SCSIO 12741]|nr:metallophosphoesterase family protein [bacterium SCSIO 12741]